MAVECGGSKRRHSEECIAKNAPRLAYHHHDEIADMRHIRKPGESTGVSDGRMSHMNLNLSLN